MSTSRVITINQIQTWQQYFLHKKSPIPKCTGHFGANPELNNKISLWQGDITHLQVDAIVNAANDKLRSGGGVCGAIHKAAGKKLAEECGAVGGTPTGTAKITSGCKLPAKYVIHAVGPKGENQSQLESAYKSSLSFMTTHRIRTIAFPSISTGIYGYPPHKAAGVAVQTVRKFLEQHKNVVDRIIFVVFDADDKENYENVLPKYFPVETPDSHTTSVGPSCSSSCGTTFAKPITPDTPIRALVPATPIESPTPARPITSIRTTIPIGSTVRISTPGPTRSGRRISISLRATKPYSRK